MSPAEDASQAADPATGQDDGLRVALRLPNVYATASSSRKGTVWLDLARSNAVFGGGLLIGVLVIACLIGGGNSPAKNGASPKHDAPRWKTSGPDDGPAARSARLEPVKTFKTPLANSQSPPAAAVEESPPSRRAVTPQPTAIAPAHAPAHMSAGAQNDPNFASPGISPAPMGPAAPRFPERSNESPGAERERPDFNLPNDTDDRYFERPRDDDMARSDNTLSNMARKEAAGRAPVARLNGVIAKPESSSENERSRSSIH